MDRRTFLYQSFAFTAVSSPVTSLISRSKPKVDQVNTVFGVKKPKQLGFTLPHEHVFSNFGQPPAYIGKFDEEKLKAQVIPYLQKIKSLGCDTVVECTTAYFGRNVKLLKEVAYASGINIITNTGWYGAARDRYIPKKAYELSIDEIAATWVDEFENGIDGTAIKPGFIKLAVDKGPLSGIDKKLIIAGARAHLKTGLTLQVHTGNNPEVAFEELDLLKGENVHPSAWVWTHAHQVEDASVLIDAARKGAWISLDGLRLGEKRQDHHLKLLMALIEAGYAKQVFLSHDGNGFPSGKKTRPFEMLMTHFIPRLRSEGLNKKDIHQITHKNPQNAFTIQVRKLS